MKDKFRSFASRISFLTGTASNFVLAICVVLVWALTGPVFHFSNTWQLFINTFTTISTFLMVFVVQNTQNRESKATQLKLDELIRATKGRDALIDLEDMTDDELAALDSEFRGIHEKQQSSATMVKLHKKVVAVHQHRQHKKSQAGQILDALHMGGHDQ